MQTTVLVTDLASRVNATDEDVASLEPVFQQMIHVNKDGQRVVTERRMHFFLGALDAAADQRKDARVQAADDRLTDAYDRLRCERMPRRASDRLVWQSTMLGLFRQVKDALLEYVDARVDAKSMKPERAAQLRAEAQQLQEDAERNVQAALRKVLRVARAGA